MTTQVEALKLRFEELKKTGLRDVKFIFGPLAERTKEDVCGSVNQVLDALESHEYDDFPGIQDSYGLKSRI
jgi:hypothetical protein